MTQFLSYRLRQLAAIFSLLMIATLGACSGGGSDSATSPLSGGDKLSEADASRLVAQSSFGATTTSVAAAQSQDLNAYLDSQFAASPSGYAGFSYVAPQPGLDCKNDGVPGSAASICTRDNYSVFQVQRRFFQNALSGPDPLRQRVAFALGQIMVVSATEVNHAYGMAGYQQLLLDRAFGNFRDLLFDVTLSPAMGRYLQGRRGMQRLRVQQHRRGHV